MKIAAALAVSMLICAGCAPAAISFNYGTDKFGNTMVDARSHHRYRSPTVSAYLVHRDGSTEPLYPYEASSVFDPVFSILGNAIP